MSPSTIIKTGSTSKFSNSILVNTVLLVDDSKSTNFFNALVLRKSGIVSNIELVENGKEALHYLEQITDQQFFPEFILLDINMPVMNGWEFLEVYNSWEKKKRTSKVIIMLGTALPVEDQEKLSQMEVVAGFSNKMLSIRILSDILIGIEDEI